MFILYHVANDNKKVIGLCHKSSTVISLAIKYGKTIGYELTNGDLFNLENVDGTFNMVCDFLVDYVEVDTLI